MLVFAAVAAELKCFAFVAAAGSVFVVAPSLLALLALAGFEIVLVVLFLAFSVRAL